MMIKEQTNARFARLEAGMTELQAQHVKYDGWFAQMHQTDKLLSGQVEQEALIKSINRSTPKWPLFKRTSAR